jgi:hypothetical protein
MPTRTATPRCVPHWRSAEMWEPDTARWAPCETVAFPGIYSLHGFATVYGVRSEEALEAGTITLSTVHALKHIAASMHRKPLIAFHESTGSVITPLGCELPGLYGRTLVLCSGELPFVHLKERMLQYRTVPREIAQALLDRLMS